MDLVMVEWLDASSVDGWRPFHDAEDDEPLQVCSVGFVVAQDKQGIILAQNVHSEGLMVSATMQIPKGMIQKITPLK